MHVRHRVNEAISFEVHGNIFLKYHSPVQCVFERDAVSVVADARSVAVVRLCN